MKRWQSSLIIGAAVSVAFVTGLCVAADPQPEQAEASEEVWSCPMHPEVRSDGPGTCPKCGMPLEKVTELTGEPTRITLTDRAASLARIRTVQVHEMPTGTREHQLLGRIEYDETRVRTVTSWTAGRIERLYVAATGERVKRNQVIASLYSPEIYAAESDLIQAVKQARKLEGATDLAKKTARSAIEAARRRLDLLGVPRSELDAIEEAGAPRRRVPIRSPFAGTVIDRMVDSGNYVSAGTPIFKIADLDKLWVQLDAYESDLPYLNVGQTVTLRMPSLADRRIEGKVTFIDPVVDLKTRVSRVRVEIDNPKGDLRPGMFAEAMLEAPSAPGAAPTLVIPASAPLFTGRRSLVYVEVPDQERPTYEAREVVLGPRAGDVYPVVSGLSRGERIVARGAFAIDADLQIRGGASMMTMPDDPTRAAAEPVADVPDQVAAALAPVVDGYLAIAGALADDDLAAARDHAQVVVKALPAVGERATGVVASAWELIGAGIGLQAEGIATASSLAEARHAFDKLSGHTKELLRRLGNPTDRTLKLAFCPMAFGNRGAEWVQAGSEIDNAYHGADMLSCGSFRAEIPPGEHLAAEPSHEPASAGGGHQH